jgi:putative transposase
VNAILQDLTPFSSRQIAQYIEFVQQGVRSPGVWPHLKGQVYLGSDVFVDTMRKRLEAEAKFASAEIPRTQRRALAKSLAYYRDEFDDAKQGMVAAYATGDYTLQSIADVFAVHYSTVSRTINGK